MRVTVNGSTIEVPDGSSVSVVDGTVCINGGAGTRLDDGTKVVVEGNAGPVRCDRGGVEVRGDVIGNVDAGNSVTCGPVLKSVSAGNNVTCGAVGGSVSAGNNAHCGDVGGNASAGNKVIRR